MYFFQGELGSAAIRPGKSLSALGRERNISNHNNKHNNDNNGNNHANSNNDNDNT